MDKLWPPLALIATETPLMLRRSGDQGISTVAELLTRSDHPENVESTIHIYHFPANPPA